VKHPKWISIRDHLPEENRRFLVLGTHTEPGAPMFLGRICACHGDWIIDEFDTGESDGEDHARGAFQRIIGEPLYWLDDEPWPLDCR